MPYMGAHVVVASHLNAPTGLGIPPTRSGCRTWVTKLIFLPSLGKKDRAPLSTLVSGEIDSGFVVFGSCMRLTEMAKSVTGGCDDTYRQTATGTFGPICD